MSRHTTVLPLLVIASFAGCQPKASDEELGTVIYSVPQVPGTEQPYPLPELGDDAAASRESKL